MAECILEHCEQEGGHLEINFTVDATQTQYRSDVSMCPECWQRMRDAKRQGINKYDVLYRKSHTAVDFDGVDNRVNVKAIRFQEVRHERAIGFISAESR